MHFIPDIYYSPVSMDFTLNWVNGAKRKSITSNELNSRLFNRKKPIIICVLLAPCTRGFIAYNGQSGIYNARKIDVNDQNIHLTWNISTWKRWNDWKSIVEKFVFFLLKKIAYFGMYIFKMRFNISTQFDTNNLNTRYEIYLEPQSILNLSIKKNLQNMIYCNKLPPILEYRNLYIAWMLNIYMVVVVIVQ